MTHTLRPTGFGPVTTTASRRRRRRIGVAMALALAAALNLTAASYLLADTGRDYLSTDGWPARGQAAYQLDDRTPAASADEPAVPIASVAKVMTAYVVLSHRPLHGRADGPRITITAADVEDTAQRRALDQSIVRVREGERLTERQALMALLLPSANNIAQVLARAVSGSVARFIAEMNRTARSLGMHDTTYTDPSGYDERTVSTAKDQLQLARVVAGDRVLTAMMATHRYRIPVEGTIRNTDTMLGSDGFVGMKTGSDDAAGGCFMFRSRRVVDGRPVELVGVVLGQRGHNLISAGLSAAKQLADRIAPRAAD